MFVVTLVFTELNGAGSSADMNAPHSFGRQADFMYNQVSQKPIARGL